jgi:hypothetical protein
MNQLADSWKKNLRPNVGSPMIYLGSWLLSHTVRRSRAEIAKIESGNAFKRVTKPFWVRHFGVKAPTGRTQPAAYSARRPFCKTGEQRESGPAARCAFKAGRNQGVVPSSCPYFTSSTPRASNRKAAGGTILIQLGQRNAAPQSGRG